MSSDARAAKPAPPLYFFNAPIDFLWVGGLSILTLTLLHFSGFTRTTVLLNTHESQHWLVATAWYLMWIVNWPHFAASSYRLYHSKTNIRQYPMTALVVPWFIVGMAIAAFVWPTVIAPLFVKLFQIWSPYHFSGQTLGITLIYMRRAGIKLSSLERLMLSSFIYGTFISMSVLAEFGTGLISFWGVQYPRFGLPEWGRYAFATSGLLSQPYLALIPVAMMYLGGALFTMMMIRKSIERKQMIPLIVFVPAITQWIWFVYTADWPCFNQFVPFFHSLQYMMIAWSMQMKESLDSRKAKPGLEFLTIESFRWGTIILIGGAILFSEHVGLPKLVSWLFNVDIYVCLAIILSAIQIHHFFVDGVIWKLKSQSVSSPLMMNVDALLHGPDESVNASLGQTPMPKTTSKAGDRTPMTGVSA
jgi:hypothetical protein